MRRDDPFFLLLLFLACLGCLRRSSGFKICAFNVQNFNDSKAANQRIMYTLTRIVSRCDICLLQEVRDSKGKAIPALVKALNRYDDNHQYKYVASKGLGRKPADEEQYVFLYRAGSVTVTDKYQYPDKKMGDVDAFSREPFVVRFKAPKTVIGEFVLIPQHTTPSNALKEIDKLYDVFEDVKKKWKVEQVMFLGDFNADCGYVTKKSRQGNRLFSKPEFFWMIKDRVDTTVRESTDCAYDRIVVHGQPFLKAIKPFSARVFNFKKEYRLLEDQVLTVSDHFPVEVELKTKSSGPHQAQIHPLLILLSVLISALYFLPASSME